MKSVFVRVLRKSRKQSPSAFASNESGTIAVLFALLLVPILGIVFGGIDYSRALTVQGQLQTAADAAAVSAAARLGEGKDAAKGAFEASFRANLPENLRDQPYDLKIAGNDKQLKVEINASVPTTLVAMLGVSKLDVTAASTAKPPQPKLFARSKAGGIPQEALPQGAAGAQARAKIRRAMRRNGGAGGMAAPKLPDQREMEEARRKIESAMRAAGVPADIARQVQMPDPAEIKRMKEMIARELGGLRF
ncbi:MAG: pilus assembly protein [Alphaproteobacteria bacterium]|nr:pilus assembly protein [Alphaproteobacteria bacterium]